VRLDLSLTSVDRIEQEIEDIGFGARARRRGGGGGGGGGHGADDDDQAGLRAQSEQILGSQRRANRKLLLELLFCLAFSVPVMVISMVLPLFDAGDKFVHQSFAGSRLALGGLLMGLL